MNEYVSLLTVAQFKVFRKAVAILVRAGIQRTQAVELLVNARIEADRYRERLSRVS